MWLFTTKGFYSIHEVEDGVELLEIRSRQAVDIDNFREHYCPLLGETVFVAHADYQYRATALRELIVVGVASVARDIDYGNFKNSVEDTSRDQTYMDVWSAVYRGLDERSYRGWKGDE